MGVWFPISPKMLMKRYVDKLVVHMVKGQCRRKLELCIVNIYFIHL